MPTSSEADEVRCARGDRKDSNLARTKVKLNEDGDLVAVEDTLVREATLECGVKNCELQTIKVGDGCELRTRWWNDDDDRPFSNDRNLKSCSDVDEVNKDFDEKFKQTTGLKWRKRTNAPHPVMDKRESVSDDDEDVGVVGRTELGNSAKSPQGQAKLGDGS